MIFGPNGNYVNVEEDFTAEGEQLFMEAVMLDNLSKDEIETFLESNMEVQTAISEEILQERTIVKLDKAAKLNRARWVAIFDIANKKKDPKYKKLKTLWKMERNIEKYLEKKYGNEAARVAKKKVRNTSNSKAVNKAITKAKSQFNEDGKVAGKKMTNSVMGDRVK